MTTAINPLSDILDGVSIPYAYKLGYVLNSYREPSFRAIEAKLQGKEFKQATVPGQKVRSRGRR